MSSSINVPNNVDPLSLSIHAINVNSIISKVRRHYLELHLRKFKPDIVFLSETCLNPRHSLQFKGYSFIRSDKTAHTRGTGILISDSFKYKTVTMSSINTFEHTAIMLNSTNNKKVLLISVYATDAVRGGFDQLCDLFNLVSPDDYIILGGDLNARHTNWSNSVNNVNGRHLNCWMNDFADGYGIKLLHSLIPSRFNNTSLSFIDLFLISNNLKILPINTFRLDAIDYLSDHRAVVLTVELPRIILKSPTFILDYSRANWKGLSSELDRELPGLSPPIDRVVTNDEVDNYIRLLNDKVTCAINNNIPKIKMNFTSLICLNEITLKCIRDKKIFRRRWFRSGRGNNLLKSLIDRLTTIISQLINGLYSENLKKKLLAIKPGPKLFQDIKRIAGSNMSKYNFCIQGCNDEAESAEALATYFEAIHNESPASVQADSTDYINTFIENLNNSPIDHLIEFSADLPSDRSKPSTDVKYNEFATPKVIGEFIKNRKNLKSFGTSEISNFVLRKLPPVYIRALTIIINNCFNNSYFPTYWKQAVVVAIPKTSPISYEVTKFRPISLLCCESKIFEAFMRGKVLEFCNENSIGNKLQFGFTAGRSTSHAITYFLEHLHTGFEFNKPCLAVSLDLNKAFDTVWIKGLVFKLKCFGFSDHLCHLLLDFLTGRTFKVRIGNCFSTTKKILAGVPQGSILGPNLFNLYISDFPLDWENEIQAIFFADDILLFKSGKQIGQLIVEMNSYLESITDYFSQWKMKLNTTKCETILIRKYESYFVKSQAKYKQNANVSIDLGGTVILAKDQIKYLGVILDRKCRVIPQIDHAVKKANGAFAMLRAIFTKKLLSQKIKEICYKQLIRPILQYGFVAWCYSSAHQMARLRSFERKVLYKCLPTTEAYYYDIVKECRRLIPKTQLYQKFNKITRFDANVFNSFIKFCQRLEACDLDLDSLNDFFSHVNLNHRYDVIDEKYIYKFFAPSFLYFTYIKGLTSRQNVFTFFNRRFNTNDLDEYVYDLAEPD